MVDRLAELKRSSSTFENSNPMREGAGDVEMGAGGGLKRPSAGGDGGDGAASKFMAEFFAEVDTIKTGIKEIKTASKKIQGINQAMVLATTSEAEAKLSAELNPLVSRTNQTSKRIKQVLSDMADSTTTLKANAKKGEFVNEIRIRENLQSTLSRKFVETIKEYQKRQQDYKDDVKKKVTRQVRIVKQDATDEEIDEGKWNQHTHFELLYFASLQR